MTKILHRLLNRSKTATDFPAARRHEVGILAIALPPTMFFIFYAASILPMDHATNPVEILILLLNFSGILAVPILMLKNDSLLKFLGQNLITLMVIEGAKLGAPFILLASESLINLIQKYQLPLVAAGLTVLTMLAMRSVLSDPLQWIISRVIGTWAREWIESGRMSKKTKFTWLDKRSIAIHEAGHAVIMAFDPLLNGECEIYLAQGPGEGSFGFCRHANWPNNVHLWEYVMMDMVGTVAGIEAERLMLGANGMSGGTDYQTWLSMAPMLLKSHPEQVFFSKPLTVVEIEHNRQTLNALRQTHQDLARRILEANKGIVQELADLLVENHRVKGRKLIEILRRVVPVEGVPDLAIYHEYIRNASPKRP